MVTKFIKAAKKQLPTLTQRSAIDKFVADMKKDRFEHPASQQRVNNVVTRFRSAEVNISRRSPETIMDPSGSVSAKLGVLMHYPTFVKNNSEFFDEGNGCVRMLIKKGFNATNSFGLDLHWAQEHSMASTGTCPRTKYGPALAKLHDDATRDVLRIVNPPLLTIVGSCPRDTYLSWLKNRTVERVKVGLDGTCEVILHIVFDQAGRVEQVATGIVHPDGIMKSSHTEAGRQRALIADCATNLFLGLAGVEHVNVGYFTWVKGRTSDAEGDAAFANPTDRLKSIQLAETKAGKFRPLHEYDSGLLAWAKLKYPDLDLDDRVKSGLSIATAVLDEMQANMIDTTCGKRSIQTAFPDRIALDEGGVQTGAAARLNELETGRFRAFSTKKWWDGAEVAFNTNSKDHIRLLVPVTTSYAPTGFLNLACAGHWVARLRAEDHLFIFFDSIGISIRRNVSAGSDGELVWRKTLRLLARFKGGEALLQHAKAELANLAKR